MLLMVLVFKDNICFKNKIKVCLQTKWHPNHARKYIYLWSFKHLFEVYNWYKFRFIKTMSQYGTFWKILLYPPKSIFPYQYILVYNLYFVKLYQDGDQCPFDVCENNCRTDYDKLSNLILGPAGIVLYHKFCIDMLIFSFPLSSTSSRGRTTCRCRVTRCRAIIYCIITWSLWDTCM